VRGVVTAQAECFACFCGGDGATSAHLDSRAFASEPGVSILESVHID
jgi:hypothetical protein